MTLTVVIYRVYHRAAVGSITPLVFAHRHYLYTIDASMVFTGFTTDRLVGLPPELFSEVLPTITLPSELKVTLHIFYRLSRQRGSPRRVSWDELVNDQVLQRSLRAISKLRPADELLDEGLEAAVRRNTLLHTALPGDGRLKNWYVVNTPANRDWSQR